jgi:hypothetical protein
VQADPERCEQAGPGCLPVRVAARREDEEDKAQHEGDVNAAMDRLRKKAEACRVVMEAGQREQESSHQPGGPRQQRAELHFRIELGLELLQIHRQLGERIRFGHEA